MKILQFVAIVLTALALVPGGAHLFALPNKINLSVSDYFIAQGIYRGWTLLGIVLIGAALANFALFTFPANQVTSNWTEAPANWQQLRWQWKMSHALNAAITFIAFCSLTISVLLAKE